MILGDFNACVEDETLEIFCKFYSFNSVIKQPICFKNPENPSCIDLILTNKLRSFRKLPPKIIHYRDFKEGS